MCFGIFQDDGTYSNILPVYEENQDTMLYCKERQLYDDETPHFQPVSGMYTLADFLSDHSGSRK